MITFTKQELLKASISSLLVGAVLFGFIGYIIGKNSEQAEFYKIKLAQEKEEIIKREKSNQAVEKALAPLYSKEIPVIDGDEKGY